MKEHIKLAIFISGKGSNARNLMRYFHEHEFVRISLLVSTKSNPNMEGFSKERGVKFIVNNPWNESDLCPILDELKIDGIVLAGFLRKISANLIARFPNKIINIHPSLLPKYGGKGMYGSFVHEAVHEAKEKETGITIHFVNEAYDQGQIIVQVSCLISPQDTVAQLEEKVHKLEQRFFPEAVLRFSKGLKGGD